MVILLSFVTKTLGMLSEKLIFRLHFPSLQKTRCLFKYSYLSQNCFRTKRNVVVIHGIRLDDIHYKHFLLISNVNFIQKFMAMITNDRCIITHSFCFSPKITQLKLLLYPGPLYFAKGGQLVKEHQLKIMKSEIKLLLMQTQ